MKINSRQKGARGERQAAKALSQVLGIEMERGARNGVSGADDIVNWPGVHVEGKRYARIAAMKFLKQSIDDAGDDLPVVVMRQDRGEWALMLRLDDLPRLCERYAKAQGRPTHPKD